MIDRDAKLERELVLTMYPGKAWRRIVRNLSDFRVSQLYKKYLAELLDAHSQENTHEADPERDHQ